MEKGMSALATAFRIVAGSNLPPADQAVLKDRLGEANAATVSRFVELYERDAARISLLVASLKAKRASQRDLAALHQIFAEECERVETLSAS